MAYVTDLRHVIRQHMTKEKYLTLSQASAYTGLSHRTLQRYVATGKLLSTKNGSGVRQIPLETLKSFAKDKHTNAATNSDEIRELLLELLELIPPTDIAMLNKRRELRQRIQEMRLD